jgi:geranylgeranyl diphosphate synthase type I
MRRLAAEQGAEALGGIVQEHLETGGKRLRARLALAATEALGGEAATAVGWAAACELLHNATLVHDDLQDGDRQRRGRPTVWITHGAEQAINAGDLLFLLPLVAIDVVPIEAGQRWDLARAFAARGLSVIRGQGEELSLARAGRTELQAYIQTVTGKTSGLFELPVEGAGIVAGRTPAEASSLAAGFRPLGVLFQLQDDVLDLYGDKGREAPGADIREGKISGLVVEHLARYPEERGSLLELLARPRGETSDAEVADVIERFRSGGALRAVVDRIQETAREVETDSTLASESELAALARELVDAMLRPIRPVVEAVLG